MKLLVTKGTQGNQIIFNGFISAEQLIENTKIDRWKPGKSIEEQGCQRNPIAAHYRKIGRMLRDDNNATLPTSLTLTLNKETAKFSIEATDIENVYYLNILEGDLYITDGQHRKMGLEYALNELKLDDDTFNRIKEMELPFCLILTKNRVEQIKMFYEINSTAKKVPTDLALQLLNEINCNQIIKKNFSQKSKLVALNICNILNSRKSSVWYDNINLTGSDSSKIASTTSFVTSLKPMLNIKFVKDIIKNHDKEEESGKIIADLIDNYWTALSLIMPEAFPKKSESKNKWCVQKTPGLYTLHLAGAFIIEKCLFEREKVKKFTPLTIQAFISKYADYGFKDYKDFWIASDKQNDIKGGEASRANSNKEFKLLAETIIDDIDENYLYNDDEEIQFN